jgi:hypothetical protein
MHPDTDGELDPSLSLETGIEDCHGSKHAQTRSYCSLRIIFMGLGIAEVHEEPIPKELGYVSLIALDDFRTSQLIRTDHVPIVFGVKRGGEFGGIDQVTKHHRELPSFRVRKR